MAFNRTDKYTATAAQTNFPYTFWVPDDATLNIHVWQLPIATGVWAQLTEAAGAGNFTVTNRGNQSGGDVVLGTGAPVNDIIKIVSAIPIGQFTRFSQPGDFSANALNDEFQRRRESMTDQERIGLQSPFLTEYNDDTIDMELDDPVLSTPVGWKSTTDFGNLTDMVLVGDLTVGGTITGVDAVLTGDLTVDGTITGTISVTDLALEDDEFLTFGTGLDYELGYVSAEDALWFRGITNKNIFGFVGPNDLPTIQNDVINQGLMISTAGAAGGNVIGRLSRGTHAAPTVVQDGDKIFRLEASAYDGSAFFACANIQVDVDGTPTAAIIPTSMSLQVTEVTTGSFLNMLKIQAGQITLNEDSNAGVLVLVKDADLTLDTGDLTVAAGDATFVGGLAIANAAPRFILSETGVTADEGKWFMQASAEVFSLGILNDAESISLGAIGITRTGATSIDSLVLTGTAIDLVGDVDVTTGDLTLTVGDLIVAAGTSDFTGKVKMGTAAVVTPNINADELAIHNDTSFVGLSLLSDTGCIIDFGDSADDNAGRIIYTHASNLMEFSANAGTQFQISGTTIVIPTNDFVVTAGETFLNLPVSAGTAGSLWNDAGTVKVA